MSSCILVGVAGPARKLGSAPMCAIMQALVDANKNLTIVQMDEEFMLDTCVTCWPTVQVLVTLYAPPFPLDKVLRYVKLRTPVLVNNLYMQRYMMDRRDIRNVLQSAGVPTPNAVIVDRQSGDRVLQSEGGDVLHVYKAGGGCDVILKPFVEKPVDPEDHSKCYSFMACLLLSPFSLLFSQRMRCSLHCKRAGGSILTTHECHALRLLTFSDHVVYSFSFFRYSCGICPIYFSLKFNAFFYFSSHVSPPCNLALFTISSRNSFPCGPRCPTLANPAPQMFTSTTKAAVSASFSARQSLSLRVFSPI